MPQPAGLALVAVLCAPPPAIADDQGRDTAVVQAAVDTVDAVMRPAYAAFAADAMTLQDATLAYCGAADAGNAETLSLDWQQAVGSLSGIEFLRIGPLLEDNRLNRVFYWPDKRRAGERQLRELLADPVASITSDSMASRSVAVQGFPALERLLYPNGEVADSDARCVAAAAVATHIADLAATLDQAWQAADGIARQMREPRPDDELLRTHEEVLRRIGTQLATGLEIVLDRKLAPVLDGDTARLNALPFVRSGAWVAHLRGNVDALRALMLDNGLARAANLDGELGFEFRIAAGHLDRLKELLDAAPAPASGNPVEPAAEWPSVLDEEQAGVVRALHSVLASIRDTMRERLLPTLGIRTGFNSEDGD